MPERLTNHPSELGERPKIKPLDFSISSDTLRIARDVLKIGLMVHTPNAQILNDHYEDIRNRLPVPVGTADMPVLLSELEVSNIAGLMINRKFGVTPEDKIVESRYCQACWEISTAFVNAGGDVPTNFNNYLRNMGLVGNENDTCGFLLVEF